MGKKDRTATQSQLSAWLAFAGLIVCAWIGTTGAALAYIDPNTGGIIFQILTPAFAALAGAWILFRRWIAAHMRKLANLFRRSDTR